MFNSKLLTAAFEVDMTNPDGSRRWEFTIEVGIQGLADWQVQINQDKDGKISMTLQDEDKSTVKAASVDECYDKLKSRIVRFCDAMKMHSNYRDKGPVTSVRMLKQLDKYFETMK